ncbi:MAG: carboxy-S-adenosyl-L-methionine synthase CmoA [Mariniblastus sp.]|nr:carboxy-S-adenosyl-L-methionine synthase CmoA [Mariniblastus sp.]
MVQIDKLFTEIDPKEGEFSFDENVARVFDDMISRSIPLYTDVQRSVPVLAGLLDHDPIRVVDLGCSTGTSLIHLVNALPDRKFEITGIDNSAAMLEKCREKIAATRRHSKQPELMEQIKVEQADVRSFEFSEASIVLMNYTLQFVEVESRKKVLRRICDSIRPGGFLLVSEKVIHAQPEMDDALVEMYFEFKRRQGYSDLEISRKRDALENVLVPLTVDGNQCLFREAGFGNVEVLLKWFNFATFVCRP